MPRIAPLDPADASGRPKELLDALQASLGATPNMARAMARSSVLEGWIGLSQALRRGSIGAASPAAMEPERAVRRALPAAGKSHSR